MNWKSYFVLFLAQFEWKSIACFQFLVIFHHEKNYSGKTKWTNDGKFSIQVIELYLMEHLSRMIIFSPVMSNNFGGVPLSLFVKHENIVSDHKVM
jgi:hypothetical protein